MIFGFTTKQWALLAARDGGPLNSFSDAIKMQMRWEQAGNGIEGPPEEPLFLVDGQDVREYDWDKARTLLAYSPPYNPGTAQSTKPSASRWNGVVPTVSSDVRQKGEDPTVTHQTAVLDVVFFLSLVLIAIVQRV